MANQVVRTSPSGPEVFTGAAIVEGVLVGEVPVWDGTEYVPRRLGFLRRTLYQTPGAGSHVCGTDATHSYIRGSGGGGAGGGCNAGAGQAAVGGGPSAAGVFSDLFALDSGSTLSFSLGAGGVPVVGTSGGDGNPTTVTYGARLYTSNPGLGSVSSTAGTTLQLVGCVDGGTATGPVGGVYLKGGPGTPAIRETATSGLGGNGGASAEAPGGTGASSPIGGNASADGQAGQFGSGGGGAVNFNNNPVAGNAGGAGGGPFLWVYEYALFS